jgi:hypothetical protein
MSKHAGISTRFALYLSTGNLSSGEELLVRQRDLVRRMLILVYVRLEQGPNSNIYRPSAPHASSNQSDAFVEKCSSL